MIYKAMQVTHIWQNENGKTIWHKTFALRLEFLVCFSLATTSKSTNLENSSWLNILPFFYCLPCWQTIVTESLWRVENGVPLNLPNHFGHLQASTMIYSVIYTEERFVCFQVVYMGLIMSLEMHNRNATDINTIDSWQNDKGEEKKHKCKGRGKK